MKAKQLEEENKQLRLALADANSANSEFFDGMSAARKELMKAYDHIAKLEEEIKRLNMVLNTLKNPSNSSYY